MGAKLRTSLIERLHHHRGQPALVIGDEITTYDDLLGGLNRWDAIWNDHGVHAGTPISLTAPYSKDACTALLSLHERGAIIVPLADLPDTKRSEFLRIAGPAIDVTIGADGSVDVAPGVGATTTPHALYCDLQAVGHAGLVLFSSGTTGASKASVLDLDRLTARYGDRVRRRRTLAFMKIDHIGGVNTILHTLHAGGSIVTTAERTPSAVFSAIDRYSVDTLPTTPTFLTMAIVSGAIEEYDTSALQLITYGTEPMPAQTLKAATALLPNVTFKQTYGLSELGIIPTKSKGDGSLWMKLGTNGFEYEIRDDVLWIKAATAMVGYLNAPHPFDERGFFNTQDKVETDGDYVRILGRVTDIINVGGEKVYPAEVESVLLSHPSVIEAAAFARPSAITGQMVVAKVQAHQPDHALEDALMAHCAQHLQPHKVPAAVEFTTESQVSDRFKKVRA